MAKFHFSAAKYESLQYLTKQLPDLFFFYMKKTHISLWFSHQQLTHFLSKKYLEIKFQHHWTEFSNGKKKTWSYNVEDQAALLGNVIRHYNNTAFKKWKKKKIKKNKPRMIHYCKL